MNATMMDTHVNVGTSAASYALKSVFAMSFEKSKRSIINLSYE